MKQLYLWSKPNWHDFPLALFAPDDACVLVGDGVFASLLQVETPELPCPLWLLAEDLKIRQVPMAENSGIINDNQWLQLILDYRQVVCI